MATRGRLKYPARRTPFTRRLERTIEEVAGVDPAQLAAPDRERRRVYARMIFARHARRHGMTLRQIGELLARNHSTVIHYLQKYDDDYRFTDCFRQQAQEVDRLIREEIKSNDDELH